MLIKFIIEFKGAIGDQSLPAVHEGTHSNTLNPIPAEVLENQDMLGGGQFDPPL